MRRVSTLALAAVMTTGSAARASNPMGDGGGELDSPPPGGPTVIAGAAGGGSAAGGGDGSGAAGGGSAAGRGEGGAADGIPEAAGGAESAAGPGRDLGNFEEEALQEALDDLGLEVVAEPEGKVVRAIRVHNLDVFGDDVRALAWLNGLRRTTREDVIAREVLLRPGEVWDPESIAESRRNLKNPNQSSLVVIRPVRPRGNPSPGNGAMGPEEVDLLVVTRDVWSLRVAGSFESQQDVLSSVSASLVETNFLGRRKLAALEFDMDLGAYSMGPAYIDPNLAGTRVEVAGTAAAVFSRDTGRIEGTRGQARVAYPLWSLDREWGASLSVRHDDSIARSFEGGELRRYDAPDTDEDDDLPWEYDRRELDVESEVVRSFSGDLIHRVGAGYELELVRPSILEDFPGDPVQRGAFARDVLPRSERAAAVFARYRLFQPRYVMYRDLDTFDLREERRLGPDIRARLSVAGPVLGSEATFVRGRGQIAWSESLGDDGLGAIAVEGDARLQGREFIDNEVRAAVTVASPRIAEMVRMVARLDASARLRETSNRFYELGGLTGLRGYDLGEYTGTRRVRGNLEARTTGLRMWLFQAGAVAFWDVGHAADRFRDLSLKNDVGLGLRVLSPQFSRFVFRVDWALPLQGADAGLPGRVTAGGGQVF